MVVGGCLQHVCGLGDCLSDDWDLLSGCLG
jgi:hypothetical protein